MILCEPGQAWKGAAAADDSCAGMWLEARHPNSLFVFLLAGPFIFVAYIAAWFILDKKPVGLKNAPTQPVFSKGKGWTNPNGGQVKSPKVEVKTKVWQAGEPPKQAFHDIRNRFEKAEVRLRKMETYVTSREYQLNKEISRL